MENPIQVGDVVCLNSDLKAEIPMAVFLVDKTHVYVYYFHPISKDLIEKKLYASIVTTIAKKQNQ